MVRNLASRIKNESTRRDKQMERVVRSYRSILFRRNHDRDAYTSTSDIPGGIFTITGLSDTVSPAGCARLSQPFRFDAVHRGFEASVIGQAEK